MVHFRSFSLPFSQLITALFEQLFPPPTWKGIQGGICSSPGELCEDDTGDNYFMERAKNRETQEKQGVPTAESSDVTTQGPFQLKSFHNFKKKGLCSTAPVVLLLSEGDRCVSPVGQLWAVLLHPLGVTSSKWGSSGFCPCAGCPCWLSPCLWSPGQQQG